MRMAGFWDGYIYAKDGATDMRTLNRRTLATVRDVPTPTGAQARVACLDPFAKEIYWTDFNNNRLWKTDPDLNVLAGPVTIPGSTEFNWLVYAYRWNGVRRVYVTEAGVGALTRLYVYDPDLNLLRSITTPEAMSLYKPMTAYRGYIYVLMGSTRIQVYNLEMDRLISEITYSEANPRMIWAHRGVLIVSHDVSPGLTIHNFLLRHGRESFPEHHLDYAES